MGSAFKSTSYVVTYTRLMADGCAAFIWKLFDNQEKAKVAAETYLRDNPDVRDSLSPKVPNPVVELKISCFHIEDEYGEYMTPAYQWKAEPEEGKPLVWQEVETPMLITDVPWFEMRARLKAGK